jgi:hypothetical protein
MNNGPWIGNQNSAQQTGLRCEYINICPICEYKYCQHEWLSVNKTLPKLFFVQLLCQNSNFVWECVKTRGSYVASQQPQTHAYHCVTHVSCSEVQQITNRVIQLNAKWRVQNCISVLQTKVPGCCTHRHVGSIPIGVRNAVVHSEQTSWLPAA